MHCNVPVHLSVVLGIINNLILQNIPSIARIIVRMFVFAKLSNNLDILLRQQFLLLLNMCKANL